MFRPLLAMTLLWCLWLASTAAAVVPVDMLDPPPALGPVETTPHGSIQAGAMGAGSNEAGAMGAGSNEAGAMGAGSNEAGPMAGTIDRVSPHRPTDQLQPEAKDLPWLLPPATGPLAPLIDQIERDTGLDGRHPLAPAGLRGLYMLAQPNGTQNGTENGTVSHRHNGVGGVGLDAVWESAFRGIPDLLMSVDLDGDGVEEIVVGTELGVVALDEEGVLWAYQLGSWVTSLFPVDLHGDGRMEIGLSTSWGHMSPRVAVLDADGHVVWEHITDYAIVEAGPAGDGSGDILAVDVTGQHIRIGADGQEVWSVNVNLLPSTGSGAVVASAYHWVFGHYLGAVGDVNGDGVADIVSAALQRTDAFVFAPVPFVLLWPEMWTSVVYATDGATGETLWIGPAAHKPSNFIAYQMIMDLELLDARGDGSLDVAVTDSGYAYQYLSLAPSVIVYSSGFRVFDGDSSGVASLVGAREVSAPALPAAVFSHLDHTDVQGDGMDELVVVHQGPIAGAVRDGPTAIERYALAPAAGSQMEMALIGDSPLAVEGLVGMRGFERADGRHIGVSAIDLSDGGYTELAPDGSVVETAALPGTIVLASAPWGDSTVYATLEGVWIPGDDLDLVPFRGAPMRTAVADYDGDDTPDLLVLSSDTNVHVLDGLTGDPLDVIDAPMPITDMAVLRADPLLLLLETLEPDAGFYSYGLDALAANGSVAWSSPGTYLPWFSGGPLLFDGNQDGVLDFVSDSSLRFDGNYSLHITTVNGGDGDILWSEEVEAPGDFYFWIDRALVASIDGGDDLVVMDTWEGIIAIDGAKGKAIFTESFDQSWYQVCMGAYDPDRDGMDTVVLIRRRFDAPEAVAYASGNVTEIKGLAPNDFSTCSLMAMPTPRGDDLVLTWTEGQADRDGHIVLYRDGEGKVWEKTRPTISDAFSSFQTVGTDQAPERRILAVREDHVIIYAAEDGDKLGEFTFDGPWVRHARFVDLDGGRQQEIAVTTVDGMVRVISDDAENVGKALANKAQGKLDGNVGDGKSSPGFSFVLFAGLAVAAFVRRK